MENTNRGRIIKGVGGLYQVQLPDRDTPVACRAKGAFRHENLSPLVGDIVSLEFDPTGDAMISDI